MLGMIVSDDLKFGQHVSKILNNSAQSLYALRVLRTHGMPQSSLYNVFKATYLSKLTYAAPAWWGFTLAEERERFEAFLRKGKKFGYCAPDYQTFACTVSDLEHNLFKSVIGNPAHLLHALQPVKRNLHYNLRARPHPFQVPLRSTRLTDGNFLIRMLLLS